jgi:putative glutamine amidotransferase
MKGLRRIVRAAVLVAMILSGTSAWTHFGRGPGAPRIGLPLSTDWYDRTELNPAATGLALSRAGAVVRNLEPCDAAELDRRLDELDGLVLVGGMHDVDPSRPRDAFEIDLVRRAEERGLPVLGLCRGAQLLAMAYGGALRPLKGEEGQRHGISVNSLAAHGVTVEPGTRLEAMLGGSSFLVSSTHFTGIADPGRLKVSARADDGVIEAVELPGSRFVVGLQWHPEWEPLSGPRSLAPFRALLAASSLRK